MGVTGSSLRYEGTKKKGVIVDDNDLETIGLGISGLGETGLSLRCDGRLQCC